MRKLIVPFLFIGIFVSCNSDFDAVVNDNSSYDSSILKLENEEAFNHLADSLSKLDWDALEEWGSQQTYKTFSKFYDEAYDDIFSSETEEEYQKKRAKYDDILVFNPYDTEDYSAYSPVKEHFIEMMLNENAEIQIGDKVVKMIDYTTENYPFYKEDGGTRANANPEIETEINTVNILANHRKLKVDFVKISNKKCKFYISTRKRFLGGWTSYDTKVYFHHPNGVVEVFEHTKGVEYYRDFLPVKGVIIYMWSRGTGEVHKKGMIIDY